MNNQKTVRQNRKHQKRYWIPDLGKREFRISGGAVRRFTDLGEVYRKRSMTPGGNLGKVAARCAGSRTWGRSPESEASGPVLHAAARCLRKRELRKTRAALRRFADVGEGKGKDRMCPGAVLLAVAGPSTVNVPALRLLQPPQHGLRVAHAGADGVLRERERHGLRGLGGNTRQANQREKGPKPTPQHPRRKPPAGPALCLP